VLPGGEIDTGSLGLPTDGPAIIRYLTNSYKGVGKKTAESLVEAFDSEVFQVLSEAPGRIEEVLPGKRAEQLLEAWEADLERRAARIPGSDGDGREQAEGKEAGTEEVREDGGEKKSTGTSLNRRRTRRGGRSRRG
jgi:hypothetical protein